MGKSTAGAAFRRAGIPVFDADAAVHKVQAKGGRAWRPIEAAFPGTLKDGAVDRNALRAAVIGKPDAIKQLEHILHPMVWREEARFLASAHRAGKRAAVLDIPLFFETGRERKVHKIVVVSAPRSVQIYRVKRRRRMSEIGHQGHYRAPDARRGKAQSVPTWSSAPASRDTRPTGSCVV